MPGDLFLMLSPNWQNKEQPLPTGLTHVSVLQGAHIIGAVPTHEGHVAQLLQAGDDKLLCGQKKAK